MSQVIKQRRDKANKDNDPALDDYKQKLNAKVIELAKKLRPIQQRGVKLLIRISFLTVAQTTPINSIIFGRIFQIYFLKDSQIRDEVSLRKTR